MKLTAKLSRNAFLFTVLILSSSIWAYDPPRGGENLPYLGYSSLLAQGASVVSSDSPSADAVNPASQAGEQRVILEADYTALLGLGADQGWGSAVGLGFVLPQAYGVWSFGLDFESTPDTLVSMPLGTSLGARVSLAKDLTPDLFLGLGVNGRFGESQSGSTDWGLSGSLGFVAKFGDIDFIKDIRLGAAMSGLGKGYAPLGIGAAGSAATAFPSPFTLAAGLGASFVKTDDVNLGATLDLAFPSFQNLMLNLGVKLDLFKFITVRAGWNLNTFEIVNGPADSFIPSFGISALIPLNSEADSSSKSSNVWDRSELKPQLAAAPLYNGTWAVGAGVKLPLGVRDRNPPKIEITYPESEYGAWYMSPNNDGKNDELVLPLSITDERYVVGYSMNVYKGDPLAVSPIAPPEASPNAPPEASPNAPPEASPNAPPEASPNAPPEASPNAPPEGTAAPEGVIKTPALSDGSIVRKIENKESRPETQSFKGILDSILYVKKGIPVPASLVWNGYTDAGDLAPDGRYTIVIKAVDDNGNVGSSKVYEVFIDRTPPEASIKVPTDSSGLIFSPDGDGAKDSLDMGQSGSVEDLWKARIVDSSGAVIRTFDVKAAAPEDTPWDGKDDKGAIAPDGVYSYVLSSTDRARNSVERRMDNIIIDTKKPPLGLVIDLAAFSPNEDGIKDVLNITVDAPVKTGLASWKLIVTEDSGSAAEVWSVDGKGPESLKALYVFGGSRNDGTKLKEGNYKALISLIYVNGYAPSAISPAFTLDVTAPDAIVAFSRGAFNPTGTPEQASVKITQKASDELTWFGEVQGPDKTAVKRFKFIGTPDESILWDGRDESGRVVADGPYIYSLSSEDRAGNRGIARTGVVKIDTEKKDAFISTDRRAFSPNSDGVFDIVKIIPEVRSSDLPAEWELTVYQTSAPDRPVRVLNGKVSKPKEFIWDGLSDARVKAPDGTYRARLMLTFANSTRNVAESGDFILDTVAPSLELSAPYIVFSPNGDGNKDKLQIDQNSVPGDDWSGTVTALTGTVLRSWQWKGKAASFSWDGTDVNGNRIPDGTYKYVVTATDPAGNTFKAQLPRVVVDTRETKVFITASALGFSPNGDGRADTMAFGLIIPLKEGLSAWSLKIMDAKGSPRKTFSGTGEAPGAQIVWDGKGDDKLVVQGEYTAVFQADYEKGDSPSARTPAFVLDTEGPKVSLTMSPVYFSPDNDGVDDELVVDLSVEDSSAIAEWRLDIAEIASDDAVVAKERLFSGYGGTGMPASRIVWDGRSQKGELVESATDYPFYLSITDTWGNTTKIRSVVMTDVLVLREGNRLKIKVPTIVFKPMRIDFLELAADKVDRNNLVIKRIAVILNRFRDYKIVVEGHAANGARLEGRSKAEIDREEASLTMPFSIKRAEAIRQMLIKLGVEASRLSVVGMGSSVLMIPLTDLENRWKNRRVEFILERPGN